MRSTCRAEPEASSGSGQCTDCFEGSDVPSHNGIARRDRVVLVDV